MEQIFNIIIQRQTVKQIQFQELIIRVNYLGSDFELLLEIK